MQDSVDFFCFTNNGNNVPPPWKVIESGFEIHGNHKIDAVRIKCLGHFLLKDYDILIWVDGNIVILGQLRPFVISLVEQGCIFTNKHRSRDCIYKEANACILEGKVDPFATKTHIEKYKEAGFPRHFGLHETTVVVRHQSNTIVRQFNEIWWNEFKNGAFRDQLSFDYVRWRLSIEVGTLSVDYFGKGDMFFKLPHVPNIMRNKMHLWRRICNLRLSKRKICRILGKILLSFLYRLSKYGI